MMLRIDSFNKRFLTRSIVATFALLSLIARGEEPSSSSKPRKDAAPEGLLTPDTQRSLDKSISDILAKTGAPSAFIALVKDRKPAYARAYVMAAAQAHKPASTAMHYRIDSISKQLK